MNARGLGSPSRCWRLDVLAGHVGTVHGGTWSHGVEVGSPPAPRRQFARMCELASAYFSGGPDIPEVSATPGIFRVVNLPVVTLQLFLLLLVSSLRRLSACSCFRLRAFSVSLAKLALTSFIRILILFAFPTASQSTVCSGISIKRLRYSLLTILSGRFFVYYRSEGPVSANDPSIWDWRKSTRASPSVRHQDANVPYRNVDPSIVIPPLA